MFGTGRQKLGNVVGYVQGRRSSGSFAIASLNGDLLIDGYTHQLKKKRTPVE